jgi:hypothetical protein
MSTVFDVMGYCYAVSQFFPSVPEGKEEEDKGSRGSEKGSGSGSGSGSVGQNDQEADATTAAPLEEGGVTPHADAAGQDMDRDREQSEVLPDCVSLLYCDPTCVDLLRYLLLY